MGRHPMRAGDPGCVVDVSRLRATQPLSDGRGGMRRWTEHRVDERSSQHLLITGQFDFLIGTHGHRAARGLIRNAVASSHQSRRARAHPDVRVTRSVPENGRRVSRITVWVSPSVAVTTRRSAGHSEVLALLERGRRRSLIRAAVQHQMEPSRQTLPVLSCRRSAWLICTVSQPGTLSGLYIQAYTV
jgi:hypothetical protein